VATITTTSTRSCQQGCAQQTDSLPVVNLTKNNWGGNARSKWHPVPSSSYRLPLQDPPYYFPFDWQLGEVWTSPYFTEGPYRLLHFSYIGIRWWCQQGNIFQGFRATRNIDTNNDQPTFVYYNWLATNEVCNHNDTKPFPCNPSRIDQEHFKNSPTPYDRKNSFLLSQKLLGKGLRQAPTGLELGSWKSRQLLNHILSMQLLLCTFDICAKQLAFIQPNLYRESTRLVI